METGESKKGVSSDIKTYITSGILSVKYYSGANLAGAPGTPGEIELGPLSPQMPRLRKRSSAEQPIGLTGVVLLRRLLGK